MFTHRHTVEVAAASRVEPTSPEGRTDESASTDTSFTRKTATHARET